MIQNEANPAKKVADPSRTTAIVSLTTSKQREQQDKLKIQDQAAFPPTPSIFEIAACRSCELFTNSNR